MLNITKKRAKEILSKYETNKGLFNWCREYINWSNENIYFGCDSEIRYILDKSFDDGDAPFSYDDLDLFDIDRAREHILYKFDDLATDEEIKEFLEKVNEVLYHNQDTKEERFKRLSDYLNNLDKEGLKEIFNDLDLDNTSCQAEVLQWVAISSDLSYWLEKQGEVILDTNYWGRQTFGQAYNMDYCIMKAFLNILNNIIN